ncbi:MAG TPA: hemolysin family protein [Gemmatimonadales bacterium]|nr:hemolysin family protein [Gemmatimonadales bacterium]
MTWLAVAAGLLLTAFGSMAGAALVTASRAELTRAISHRLRGRAPTLRHLAEVDGYLTAASVTTSLGVLLLGAALPALLASSGALRSLVVLALLAVPLIILVGYFAPRWLTQHRAEAIAARVVPILRPWSTVVGLLLPARAAARPHELRSLWREGAAAGLAVDEELVMAGGVLTFSQRPVREVVTPRTDIVAVPVDAPPAAIADVFAQSGYSRLPVYRGSLDEIVGMLHAFDLFKLRPGSPLPIRPVAVAPGSRSCGDLLLDMQRERRHLAVVIDEFGGTLGIVTFEDLLEELVGEIFDEYDEPDAAAPEAAAVAAAPPPPPEVLEVDGTTPASEVAERFGVELPQGRAASIGGLVAELAGRIPADGERFLLAGLEFDVLHSSPTRVERLLVRPGPVPVIPLHADFA